MQDDEKKASERTCIVTGETLPKAALIRFVVGPEGQVVPDLQCKLPGRGIWVKATRAAVTQAVAKKSFSRGAKKQVSAALDLPVQVERLLQRQLADWLALARKAGAVVTGFDAVDAALRQGEVKLLLIAEDAKGDAEKIRRLAREIPSFSGVSREALGRVTGRENTVYLAVTGEKFGETILEICHRHAGFIENNAL